MERIEGYLTDKFHTDKFHAGLLRVMEGRWGEELPKDWHNPLVRFNASPGAYPYGPGAYNKDVVPFEEIAGVPCHPASILFGGS